MPNTMLTKGRKEAKARKRAYSGVRRMRDEAVRSREEEESSVRQWRKKARRRSGGGQLTIARKRRRALCGQEAMQATALRGCESLSGERESEVVCAYTSVRCLSVAQQLCERAKEAAGDAFEGRKDAETDVGQAGSPAAWVRRSAFARLRHPNVSTSAAGGLRFTGARRRPGRRPAQGTPYPGPGQGRCPLDSCWGLTSPQTPMAVTGVRWGDCISPNPWHAACGQARRFNRERPGSHPNWYEAEPHASGFVASAAVLPGQLVRNRRGRSTSSSEAGHRRGRKGVHSVLL